MPRPSAVPGPYCRLEPSRPASPSPVLIAPPLRPLFTLYACSRSLFRCFHPDFSMCRVRTLFVTREPMPNRCTLPKTAGLYADREKIVSGFH